MRVAALVAVCPAYEDAPVWLGKATGEWDTIKALCKDMTQYDPYEREARLLETFAPGATPVSQMESIRLAMRNACVMSTLARKAAEVGQDPSVQPLLDKWMKGARQALAEPDPSKWSDPLAPETLRLQVVLAGQRGDDREALTFANQAATLLGYLADDPWHNRLETVEMEVYLDQAWFGWLTEPQTPAKFLAPLERQLRTLVRGPAETYSEQMAAQFAGLLWLSLDRQDKAAFDVYTSQPGSSWPVLIRRFGLGYARLVTLVGSRVPAETNEMWITRGKKALGDGGPWTAALDQARRVAAPWWFGVMSGR